MIQVGQALLKNKDREVENSDPEDSEEMCSQKEKLQELKLLATNSCGELRTKESWQTLFCMVVTCILSKMKTSTVISSISKLACVDRAELLSRFKHFFETGDVLVTDSKGRARAGDANGRCIVKKYMRRQLPSLIASEILAKDIPLTSGSVGELISQTWFEEKGGVISIRAGVISIRAHT